MGGDASPVQESEHCARSRGGVPVPGGKDVAAGGAAPSRLGTAALGGALRLAQSKRHRPAARARSKAWANSGRARGRLISANWMWPRDKVSPTLSAEGSPTR